MPGPSTFERGATRTDYVNHRTARLGGSLAEEIRRFHDLFRIQPFFSKTRWGTTPVVPVRFDVAAMTRRASHMQVWDVEINGNN